MEEQAAPGSSNPTTTQRTTGKLPSQDATNNGALSTSTASDQNQAARTYESLQLVVVEGFQVGRGAARIDPGDIARLSCQPGDSVMISGARTTAAKVVPAATVDRGKQIIQMDSQVRQNSASGLGERVSVHKAKVKNAEKVTLLPLSGGAPIQESDLQYIARYLIGLPVVIGDLLRVGTPGAASREFLIISTIPATPSYTIRKRTSGSLDELVPPVQQQPVIDTEAVLVHAGTIVRAQARGATRPGGLGRVSYEDIGGLGKELQRIREMIELPLKYPAVFDRLGVEPPKGVLLYGPPGTGKTLIARAVASETNAAFFVINGPEIMNKLYGESESRLRSVFQEAQRRAPGIIFIDELDALAPKRSETEGELERRIVGQLLALMDGIASRGQVLVIGATNQPNSLDPALRRPGRFDREIALRVPDLHGRMEILRIHSRDAAVAVDVDFARLAQLTPGFVGADLEALCREAAMIALRRVLPHIDYERGYIPYETLVNLNITMADFQAALREIEPSTTREVYVEVSETSWDDIGGLVKAKAILTEGVEWPLRFPELYTNAKIEPPRGVLLSGPSGSGKTLLARALANQCEASFISIKGPELLSKWIGESEKGIREVFRRAKQAAPCIVFFDEIDAIAARRGIEIDGHAVDRVIAQLLTEMDGIEGREGVIVVAATNRTDLIDPALLRPGRFDLVIELEYPNESERCIIFGIHTRGRPLHSEVSLEELASLTKGRNGADIEAICRRAALLAMHEWIAPRLNIQRVEVTEALEDASPSTNVGAQFIAPIEDQSIAPPEDSITPAENLAQTQTPLSGMPLSQFQIRIKHFIQAIDEQNERYTAQREVEEVQARKEAERQRLIEMAANISSDRKPRLRGFRLWLARLFRLVP
jgi:transitional endoplasmic reticulum ATPase